MEQPNLEALLRLMKMLTNNTSLRIPQIAERLRISTRSVERYIETLRHSGFIINHPRGGAPYLEKHSPFFKEISELVHFTDEETDVVRRVVDAIDENNPLKGQIRRKLHNAHHLPYMPEVVVREQDCRNIHLIIEAIETEKQATLQAYRSANSNEVSNRLVEPFAFTTNYQQVWCYELASSCCKLFKVARIGNVSILETPWQHENLHREGFIDLFRMTGNNRYSVELHLNVRAYNLLIEEYPLAQKNTAVNADGSYQFRAEVTRLEGVGRFVMGLLPDITIVNSPELAEFVGKRLEELKNNFSTTVAVGEGR
ncbi:helix-turn-helix transcriptional regulator [Acetobacteroides hydrogenigenes]|uniref:Putative DNA-binding transcriptional regulator YafY n=1 Tax=Acetobacteroides hydrogenigenes TaxID=979970 RepID=A0A4R2E5E6_9BACT|nr:WYL domain-containing transcriptional regulator [Acetobacteroides hydrogenigenes]TCN62707.1 putative DNA-binding transcriptional regulator YafY [Acetobacteroides hydrogenigenes]